MSQVVAVAVALVGVMVLVGSFLFKKKRPARSGERRQLPQTASVLAGYFGTMRSEAFSKMDPVKAGTGTLELLDSLQGEGVSLLRAIASDAMAREQLPEMHDPGTQAFSQVSSAIGDVCRQLQKAGYN
ncbi:MAG: hypothetical protein FJZ43_02040 [Candidatus Staskawiczbacteria bacterium]|nr:hypothetical protein [Candidatus Staskawiczbacteria bacterium]